MSAMEMIAAAPDVAAAIPTGIWDITNRESADAEGGIYKLVGVGSIVAIIVATFMLKLKGFLGSFILASAMNFGIRNVTWGRNNFGNEIKSDGIEGSSSAAGDVGVVMADVARMALESGVML